MNLILKSRMVLLGVQHKQIAAEMHMNVRVFGNKLNRRSQPNGNTAHFSAAEKAYLATRLDMDATEIE